MKFFLKLISVLAFLFTSPLLAQIDEYKSDLYYANGIMMSDTEESALGKWEEQVDDLFSNELETYSKISSIRVSYNMSQGFIDDILEAFEQVTRNEWDWQAFTTFITVYLTQHNIQEDWQAHINDLTRQVDSYKQSIKDGHGVIVIAHSQGNYFTNEAYELLDDWMKSYFKMMGVATPANHVAGFAVGDITAPYVTFHNDFINFVITGLPSNRTDTRHHGFPSVAAHDFYESYLKEETTKGDIVRFIEQKIEEHTEAPSQWETDQEFERGTMNYRITVKHRFDTSVIMNEEVYPFNASKKLYSVNGEYVKASCGGENISASWEGQAENEFYLLEGTGEIIVGDDYSMYIFALATTHPSGHIYSSGNTIRVVKLKVEPTTYRVLQYTNLRTIGTFMNQPNLYSMWYSDGNRPVYGHSVYWLYQGTEYEGLSERYMYPSASIEELASKLTYPTKMASNYSGGNLYRHDNFWTNFSPKSPLQDVILELNNE